MVAPDMLNGGDHFIFLCGNHPDAKEKVKDILVSFGWKDKNIPDLGEISASRATEIEKLLPDSQALIGPYTGFAADAAKHNSGLYSVCQDSVIVSITKNRRFL